MRAPAVSPAKLLGRLALVLVALLLATVSMTTPAKADEPSVAKGDGGAAVVAGAVGESADGAPVGALGGAGADGEPDAPTLAGHLSSGMLRVSADVALVDSDDEAVEPVVGSFTVDGLTYAIVGEGQVALVAVSPRTLAGGLTGGSEVALGGGSPGAPSEEGSGSGAPPRSGAEQVPSGAASPQPQPSPSVEAADSGEAVDGSMAASLAGAGDESFGSGSDGAEGLAAPGPDASADAEGAGEPEVLTLPETVFYDGSDYSLTAIGPRALAGCDAATVVIPASVASVDQAAFEGSPVASVEVADGSPHLSSYDGMLFDADQTRLLLIPEGKQGAARIPETAEGVLADALSHSGGPGPSAVGAGGAAYLSRNGCLYDASGALAWAPPEPEGAAPSGHAGVLPAASLGEAAASRGTYDITVKNVEGSTLYKVNAANTTATPIESRVISCGSVSHQVHLRFLSKNGSLIVQLWHNTTSDDSYYRWLKPGHVLVGVRVSNGSATDEIRASAVGTSYTGSSAIKGAGRTIEPIFEQVTYAGLRLDKQGGTGGSDSVASVRYGQSMPAITPPTKVGYKFAGYTRYSNGNGTKYYDEDGKSAHVWDYCEERPTSLGTSVSLSPLGRGTLYAYWEKIGTVTMRFDPQGATIDGVEGPHVRNCAYADGLTLAAVGWPDWAWAGSSRVSRPGYSFKGWFTQPSGGSQVTAASPLPATSTTYYAQWSAKTVWYYLDPNGGAFTNGQATNLCSRHVTYDGETTLGQVTWLDPIRSGYSFEGWFTAASGGSQVTSATVVPYDYPTYYAHWKGRDVTLSWDSDGGSTVAATTQTYADGAKVALPEPPSRPGYEFKGWFDAEGSQVTGQTPLPTSNAAYHARWEAAHVWWYFDPNGGAFTNGQTTTIYADGGAYDPSKVLGDFWWQDARRHGYRFDGWFTAASGGSQVTSATVVPYDYPTYYAHWSQPTVWYYLDPNGGAFTNGQATNLCSRHVTYDGETTLGQVTWLDPIRSGYSFEGWFTAASGGSQVTSATVVPYDYPTYYAHWKGRDNAISYELGGGELDDPPRSYTIEDADFDLPTPTRYGYRFDGWDVEGAQGAGVEDVIAEDGSKSIRVKQGTYGDLSCTARWTLRYDLDVPVADPGSVTFEADSLTGQVRVKPGTSAEGAILSYMAVPVALDEVSCEGLGVDGSPDDAGGAPELEAVFGTGSAAKVRFTATLGEGDAALTAKVTAGGAASSASLAGLSIPAAASKDAPGRLPVAYGLELDPDLAIPPMRDAAPVARLTYTMSLPGAGA